MAASAVAAYFSASGAETEVVSFHYELSRSVDSKGRPSSVTQGGVLHVELTSSAEDSTLAEWLANSYTEHDGQVRFVDRIGPASRQTTLKTVEFSKGPGVERVHQVCRAVQQDP